MPASRAAFSSEVRSCSFSLMLIGLVRGLFMGSTGLALGSLAVVQRATATAGFGFLYASLRLSLARHRFLSFPSICRAG